MPSLSCSGCGCRLSSEEREYYESSCEQCVTTKHNELQRWRAGDDNPELDKRFSVPATVIH